MKISKTFLLFAFTVIHLHVNAQLCTDASIGTSSLVPNEPAIVGQPLLANVQFCNDIESLPLEPNGPLRIQISESKMDPNGMPTIPSYFTAAYLMDTWILTQTGTIPGNECINLEIPYIVTELSDSDQSGVGISINIVPSISMVANGDCFIYENDGSSAFTYSGSIVSLNLNSFTVEKRNKSSLLIWQTSHEIDHDFFEVQVSTDGNDFRSIGSVKGENKIEKNEYSFIDAEPSIGDNYYRLKHVDLSGNFEYSTIRILNFVRAEAGSIFDIFPNPIEDYVKIRTRTAGQFKLRIYDATGNLVNDFTFDSEEEINTSYLRSGVYLFKIFDNNNLEMDSHRIIVSN